MFVLIPPRIAMIRASIITTAALVLTLAPVIMATAIFVMIHISIITITVPAVTFLVVFIPIPVMLVPPVPGVAIARMCRIRQGGTWHRKQCGERYGAKKMLCVHGIPPDVRINALEPASILW
jgi:hypothetical protein